MTNIRSEMGEPQSLCRYQKDNKGIQYELDTSTLDNLDKMDCFLIKHKLSQLTQHERDHLNSPITVKEMELVILKLPKKKSPGPHNLSILAKCLEKNYHEFYTIYTRKQEEKTLPPFIFSVTVKYIIVSQWKKLPPYPCLSVRCSGSEYLPMCIATIYFQKFFIILNRNSPCFLQQPLAISILLFVSIKWLIIGTS